MAINWSKKHFINANILIFKFFIINFFNEGKKPFKQLNLIILYLDEFAKIFNPTSQTLVSTNIFLTKTLSQL